MITMIGGISVLEVALLRGMTEAGFPHERAEALIEEKFVKSRQNQRINRHMDKYVSKQSCDLMEAAGVIKPRRADRVAGEALLLPDQSGFQR